MRCPRCTTDLGHARVGRLPPLACRPAHDARALRLLLTARHRRRGSLQMKTLISCSVNGEERTALADTRDTLLELLRDRLGLTGAKEGCGNGNCGTCTVLVDGEPVCSCLMLAQEAPGHDILTI